MINTVFLIPDEKRIPELISLLQSNFSVRMQAETVSYRVFYDTFDWRLYKNGSVLEAHDDGQLRKVYWRTDKNGKLKIQLGLRRIPHLAGELPAGGLRQQLQPVISVRELSPRIKIKIKRLPVTVLDANKKVVVHINFDEYWYRPSKLRAAKVLARHLKVKPVKGYPEDYRRVVAFFQTMGLYPAQDNIMKLALALGGINVGEYTTRLNLFFDPDMPAEQVLKKILLRLLEIMQQNTSGCIKGRDIEFMHDYRVSIRKTRTALKQINNVLPQTVSTKYKKFFSMLGKLTTPVRDLDVLLLLLEDYQQYLEASAQLQIQPMREYLLRSREKAQKKLIERLKSSEYRENIKQWHDYLEHSGTESFPPDKSSMAVYKLADELLWSFYQQTIAQGNAITENSTAEELHELRKTFKKLRYLMDFFRSLYPAGNMSQLIQLLKELQDSLGEYNDLDVHAGIVNEFIKQCNDEAAIKAGEQMINILQQQQDNAGKNFRDGYVAFSSSDNQNKFREIFIDYHRSGR